LRTETAALRTLERGRPTRLAADGLVAPPSASLWRPQPNADTLGGRCEILWSERERLGLRRKRMAGTARAIQRVMRIDGVVLPAIIHNANYYFVNLPVYADGLVDAWELLDRRLFEAKLATGWVTTFVPDGAQIHVHGLGAWTVDNGEWALTPRELGKLVQKCVGELNPEMANLYDFHGKTTRKVGNVNVSIMGRSSPCAVRPKDASALPNLARGRSLSVFSREGDDCYLADLRVFDDGTAEVGRLPESRTVQRDELESELSGGRLFTKPVLGQRVRIHGLGAFTVRAEGWSAEAGDLILESRDLFAELAGEPTSLQKCRARYEAFLERPTVANRDALRQAHEAVPEHNRVYLGDMDVRDIPIRMIIYGREEVENWSHRIVAREQGEPKLPTITVPDLEDSDDDT